MIKQKQKSTIPSTIWNLIKITVAAAIILFVVALFSPVKATYVLSCVLPWVYIVLACTGDFIVHCALSVLATIGAF